MLPAGLNATPWTPWLSGSWKVRTMLACFVSHRMVVPLPSAAARKPVAGLNAIPKSNWPPGSVRVPAGLSVAVFQR